MGLEDPLEELVRREPAARQSVYLTEMLAGLLAVGARTPADLVRLAGQHCETDDARSMAIWMLGHIDDGAHATELIDLLGDASASDELRHEVTQAVMYVDDPRVIDALRAALAKDLPSTVRCSAASALGHNPYAGSATGDLIAILLDASDDPEVRGFAAEALGHSFQNGFLPTPPEAQTALRTTVLDPDETVRYESVWALGQIGRLKDVALLERVLAAEEARPAANARIVKEATDAIAGLAKSRRKPR